MRYDKSHVHFITYCMTNVIVYIGLMNININHERAAISQSRD
jgi:hypothetical protein